ncbi:MAG TPA: phage integrase N-terminal SAM-like domain-containing protein [Terriglobales bacterium]|nr:phage integrase N-terminal SAM-like domain-containing protein [Terriglobales bacterium]
MFHTRNNMFVPRLLLALPFRTPSTCDKHFRQKRNWELVNDFADWLVVQRYTEGTRKMYNRIIRDFCQFMANVPFRQTTHSNVRRFVAVAINRTLSLDNGKRYLMILRLFFDFLYLGGAVEAIPPRLVYLRRGRERKIPEILSEAKVARLIDAAANVRDRAVLELLYATGCRAGELVRIRVCWSESGYPTWIFVIARFVSLGKGNNDVASSTTLSPAPFAHIFRAGLGAICGSRNRMAASDSINPLEHGGESGQTTRTDERNPPQSTWE